MGSTVRRGWRGRPRRAAIFLLLAAAAGWIAFQASPWPSALLVRAVFDHISARTNERLARHVPQGVTDRLDLHYDARDRDALLDLYLPDAVVGSTRRLPLIVWVHGGGFVAGRKEHIRNYSRILASHGFVVATVGYSIAPRATWPTPTRQVNAALDWLQRRAADHSIDADRVVLAGDSAGAQIAAELANAITSPAHAARVDIVPTLRPAQLSGMLLYCGPYDVDLVNWDGDFAWLLRTMLWSYSGERRIADDPRMDVFSVARHVSGAFPPAFISVGNGDPLAEHSFALADALRAHGVAVDTLFFPDDHAPPLPHVYQFNLDDDAGRLALARSLAFLRGLPQHAEAPGRIP